jgi:hypothetical protein
MKLYEDLKYIGNGKLKYYGNNPWHCTNMAREYSTDEMKYCIRQPQIFNGKVIGYDDLNTIILTEKELIENFKIIKGNGVLEDIKFNNNNEYLSKVNKYFSNMSKEDFKKLID